MTESETLEQLIANASLRLRTAGIPEPWREARRIWADLKGLASSAGYLPSVDLVGDVELVRYRAAVERRAGGEPLPYVTGFAGFRQLLLHCDRRALIPRPETEGLVDLVLARAPGGRVADLGTGSGCIALALAAEGEYQSVVGVERSPAALALAAENRRATGLDVAVVEGDLATPFASEAFDALVANPPYLTDAEYDRLDPSVKAWEPREALVGGGDGLGPTRTLLGDGRRVVRAGGLVALEIDASRAPDAARLALEAGWCDVSVHDDLFGRARYLLARRSEAQ